MSKPPMLPSMLERAYHTAPHEVDLTSFIAVHDVPDDQMLAELIETDGRIRIATGKSVVLERYLDAVPNLGTRPDPLDAAIDVVLRARSHSGHPSTSAVEELIQLHPEFEVAIREAAQLSNMLVSTDGLQARLRTTKTRELPDDFGPELSDGRARYELRQLLGEGAFGQVYLAVDRHLSEPGHPATVAIKILHERDEATPGQRERLIDEATTARRVDHPNVVRVMDRGTTTASEDYIVYEYVDGGDLAIALGELREPMPIRKAAILMANIARGVQAAHLAGLVHCDLKPGNIMMTSDGEPKVADFGIAARLDDPEAWPGESGDLSALPLGNLAFIAPEQFRKEPGAANIPADVFALGGMLFLLLTGQLPNGNSIEQIAVTHDPDTGREIPPAASALRRGVDRDLELITQRAMAPDPRDRYSSAAALADDLDGWARHEPLRWTKPSIWRLAKLWARRRPALAAAGVLLIGAVFVAQHFWLELRHERQLDAEVEAMIKARLQPIAEKMRDGLRHESEIMMGIWLLEDVVGPEIMKADGIEKLWDTRIGAYRTNVERDLEAGRTHDMQTLMRESQLAFWLVTQDEVDEARTRIARNRESWAEVLRADDPWLGCMDTLGEVADVKAAIAAGDEATVRTTAEALEQRLPFLRESLHDSPVHHLTLTTLAAAYGKSMLRDTDARTRVVEEFAALKK